MEPRVCFLGFEEVWLQMQILQAATELVPMSKPAPAHMAPFAAITDFMPTAQGYSGQRTLGSNQSCKRTWHPLTPNIPLGDARGLEDTYRKNSTSV